MIKLKELLNEVSEGGPGSGRPRTGRAPKLDPKLVAHGRKVAQAQIDYQAGETRKRKRRDTYAKKKTVREGGPGSGKRKTGAPKLQEPWKSPEPVKHTSKLSRKSRSKEQDPTARQVRSTKGKRAPKLKQFGEGVQSDRDVMLDVAEDFTEVLTKLTLVAKIAPRSYQSKVRQVHRQVEQIIRMMYDMADDR